jgi:DNA modification methylase
MPSGSVHCVVTSPPYWGLRDYGHDGQIGLEERPEAYVARLVDVFREVRRVLRDDGTVWLNLGDSYAAARGGTTPPAETLAGGVGGWTEDGARVNRDRHDGYNPSRNAHAIGLKHKDLVGIPWRVAFALQADGWWLRQDIIWHKPNPMPESVTDRCTKAHEYVFLLTKSARYFYDAEAVAEPALQPIGPPSLVSQHKQAVLGANQTGTLGTNFGPATRNRRSVWTITTKPFSGAHFAVMPPDLVEPCVLAGTSEKGCCPDCGAPMQRVMDRTPSSARQGAGWTSGVGTMRNDGDRPGSFVGAVSETKGWASFCDCATEPPIPCTVLDPFGGAGTTALVADRLGRNAIICELNPEYVNIAAERLRGDNPLFSNVTVREAV